MKISLSRAMFETRHELVSVKQMLREAEGEAEDEKADLKKKALVTVKAQGTGFQELGAKMAKAGMPQAGNAVKAAGDTLVSLSTETDLDDEGVGKFAAARTLGAALANFFSAVTGELAAVGEESSGKTLAELLAEKGIKQLEETISINLIPSAGAAKLLKRQNNEFAQIFKKEEPDTVASEPEGTAPEKGGEQGADAKVKESDNVFEFDGNSLSEAGIGSMFADLLKKFLGAPPKTAKQTVEMVSPLVGGKNMAKLILADMKKATYEQYATFIPTVKKIFVVVNPEKKPPLPPAAGEEEGEAGAQDAASKGARVAAGNPELVDRISDEAKKKLGDSSAAAMEVLKKIAKGVDPREAVNGIDDETKELLKPILATLGSEGANANPKSVVAAVAGSQQEGEEGQSLSSILFQAKSTKKKKLGDKGTSIDNAIKELSASWESYNSGDKFTAPLKKDIVSKFKAMKDVLSDVKTENAHRQEEIIIERWQRLAGIK
jgi:hypothetical protein